MAVANTVVQSLGNPARSSMGAVDMDGVTSFLTGTVIGYTIDTLDAAGTEVDAEAILAYTSTAANTPRELMNGLVAVLNAALDGASARYSENTGNEYALHIEALAGVAQTSTLTVPVFIPGT